MNLITDPWIPVIRKKGPDKIMPWEIADTENPVMEINAPRPDFQGALYQFLIGLLQTCFAPEDEDEWLELWKDFPPKNNLKSSFEKVSEAFNLSTHNGPAFMQDHNLPEGESKKISTLLIESPGGKTIKDNLDHFIKRDQINSLCPGCVATALFTLQTNAPAGGSGHRVGLRGGGPLTTLILPEKGSINLWRKLWLNVLNKEEFKGTEIFNASVFPWMGPTRLSDKKGASTTSNDVHPLQMYWGMPRRIRLEPNIKNGRCDICNNQSESLYKGYRTKNHGTDYVGAWVHPLTPYYFDPKKENPPLSLKGQKGGLGYRHWLGLTLQNPDTGDRAATIVQFFNSDRGRSIHTKHSAFLWCFGYDMDKMKARCWYDTRFPVFALTDKQRENMVDWAGEFINSAKEVVKLLRSEIKSAWYNRPGDVKGDMSAVDYHFWEQTESEFYQLIDKLIILPEETRMVPHEVYLSWLKTLRNAMFDIFDKMTIFSNPEDVNLKRIVKSRNSLKKNYSNNKFIKNIGAK